MRKPGDVGNLPSGETYIVPYEGEKSLRSLTSGDIPVQIENELVIYRIRENKTVEIIGDGPIAEKERQFLKEEPAYGNIAEIGFGILRSLGVKPITDTNSLLVNEKLGLHIAWGRSEHFGGMVGPKDFKGTAIHLDRVFIPELMPMIKVKRVDSISPQGQRTAMIVDDEYTAEIFQ